MEDAEQRFLLLNSNNISSVTNMALHVGTVAKHPSNPLFIEDRPWEQRFDNLYGNIIFEPDQGLYKCWYSPFIVAHSAKNMSVEERLDVPYEGHEHQEMGVCYAESADGISWQKPDLGLVDYDGSKHNNLVMRSVHGAGVVKDDLDSDSRRRYKSIFQGLSVSFSPDGIDWSSPQKINCELNGDTHNNVIWVANLNKYVCFTRDWTKTDRKIEGAESKVNHSWSRKVARIESKDFAHWSSSQTVIEGESWELQPYSMTVFEYAGIYLGLLAIHDQVADRVWTELAYSVDTLQWHRIDAGRAFIGCSETPLDYDYGCVYACIAPVFLEHEVRLYYGGSDWLHFGWRNGCLALATMRPDGFAGYQPNNVKEVGVLTTAPIMYQGEEIKITADIAPGGSVEIKLLDIKGDSVGEGKLMRTSTDAVLIKSSAVVASQMRIEFRVRSATIFSFVLVKNTR